MNRIAVLTSGGDAPGMNACVRAVVRTALNFGLDVYGIERGYQGLIDGDVYQLNTKSVSDIIQRGGTFLRSARCPEFVDVKYQQKAAEVLNAYGIEGLIVIGGDGTFRGAQALSKNFGINVIGIPGTIDNDLGYTDFTLGFDTAVNTVLWAINSLRDTMHAHDRVSVLQVMGRHCGDIALYSAITGGAEYVLVPEVPYDIDEIAKSLKKTKVKGKTSNMIVFAEGAGDSKAFMDKLQELTAEGYRFDGWFYGETRFTAETEITSSLTLTAKWTKTYTVTFDANGGTGEMNPQIFTYGEPQNLLPNKFSVDGKEFLGWAKTSGGSIAYDDNSEYTIGAADVTLYAVWGKFVTADNAATVIAGLESGTSENPNVYTVKIISKEESDKDFLREINDKIYSRWREYVKVNLDLSASGITEIPENAFDGANLLGITLPNSLESIKTKAFLETYTLEKIVIPDKVRIIEAEAFKGCHKLAEITLPASLTNIGEYAFSGCDRLETVNYKGTQAQWAQIKIDVYNEKLTGANIVYNYTGE